MADQQRGSDSGFFRRVMVATRSDDRRQRGVLGWLRRRFVVGFLVALPLVVTLFFARFMFQLMDRWFRPISRQLFEREIPGLGLLLVIVAMLLLGIFAANVIGGRLLDLFERLLARVPLLSPIYQGARQITEAIQIRETAEFRKVVLLEFPKAGLRSIGFVTREFGHATGLCDEPSYMIFVPTTPNPTSGFLVAAPKRDVTVLEITVEEGVKMLISGGLLIPSGLLSDPTDVRRLLDPSGPEDAPGQPPSPEQANEP
jgi:uncharacterized membrane protein